MDVGFDLRQSILTAFIQHIEGKFPDCWQKQQDGKECWELLAMKYILGIGKKRQSVSLFWFYNLSPQTQHNRRRLSRFAMGEPLATYGYWAFEMQLVWIWMCYKWKTCTRFEHTMRKSSRENELDATFYYQLPSRKERKRARRETCLYHWELQRDPKGHEKNNR